MTITFGMRYLALQREIVAGLEMLNLLADGQSHLATHHPCLQGERVGVRVERGIGRPTAFKHLVESFSEGLRFEFIEGACWHGLASENGQGGGVVRLVLDFADQFAVDHLVVFVEDDDGTGRDAGQRAAGDGDAVGFEKFTAAHGR